MAGIPCSIIRGGTSKGVFILEDDLPSDPMQRDALLLQLMGSPDARQIDGLGGADPLTSKVVIVSRSQRPGIDVEYESLEIGVAEAHVNRGIMCGNLLAGVGGFAVAEGLVQPHTPLISTFCRSNGKTVSIKMPHGAAGLHARASGAQQVGLFFADPGGAVTGRLLPTGEPSSLIPLNLRSSIEVSIVDAGTLYVFARAEAFGLRGDEDPGALDDNSTFRSTVELLRGKVAALLTRNSPDSRVVGPRLVKVAIVAPSQRDDAQIVTRVINPASTHKAYAVSGAICLAAAAAIPETVVHNLARPRGSPFSLTIAHPGGTMRVLLNWSKGLDGIYIHGAEVQRTARLLMRGTAYVGRDEASISGEQEALRQPSVAASVIQPDFELG